ncbi:hypothetical protein C8R46DRAFT_1026867 [Mycena filopes]|nr:hypothetical protein C8R46DRAFT_1026867 [Mycena filopes]
MASNGNPARKKPPLIGTPRAAPPAPSQSSASMANTEVDGEGRSASGAGGSATARERYHYVYDAREENMDDPLLYYGAVDGLLPGKSAAQSNLLRDVVIRYDERHRNFEWEDLSSLIASIYRVESSAAKVFSIADPTNGRKGYCLDLRLLSLVGHAVVAVQQILDSINAFSTPSPRRRFEVDTGFMYLRMLEDLASKTELRFVLSVLQLRLDQADTHIRAHLSGIRETLTGQAFTETLDSVVSTVSEVREKYGSGTPSQQLYRLMARHDYGRRAQIIDRTAYHQLVESIRRAEVIDPRTYKSRQRGRARSNSPEMDPVVEETVQEEAPASAAPAANAGYFGPIPSGVQFLGGHR